ncbi:MAG: hypothetical protein ACSLE6_02185 [Mycobacterium sp.]
MITPLTSGDAIHTCKTRADSDVLPAIGAVLADLTEALVTRPLHDLATMVSWSSLQVFSMTLTVMVRPGRPPQS